MKNYLNKFVFTLIVLALCSVIYAQDIIITNDAQKIDAKILEVSKTEIKYKELNNLEGPTFVLETGDIHSVIYANGKVVLYEQNKTPEPLKEEKQEIVSPPSSNVSNNNTNFKQELNLARVANYSGIYVFADCTPIGQYEVLGDVYFDKEGAKHIAVIPNYGYSHGSLAVTGSSVISYSETPQYTDIRNGLIAQAVMANRQVEGILLSFPKEGEGRATLIKFKEGVSDKSLAKVNSHLGIFVFTDCMPVNTYSFVGKISKAEGLNTDYNNLRDRLIRKALNKYSVVQGIIPRFVSGANDTAEAIRF